MVKKDDEDRFLSQKKRKKTIRSPGATSTTSFSPASKESHEVLENAIPDNSLFSNTANTEHTVGESNAAVSVKKRGSGKPLSSAAKTEIANFVHDISAKGVSGLREEFQELQKSPTNVGTFRTSQKNIAKNRFKTVGCIDETRTVLTLDVPPETDYVHANWVKMWHNSRTFIATQAPLETTIGDFWRLCYQESVSSILMLCNPVEEGVSKCPQYWPTEIGVTSSYGRISVTTKKYIVEQSFFKYFLTVSVTDEKSAKPLNVSLFLMLKWPTKGIPLRGGTLLTLLRAIDKQGICVVVCLEGIGRTGVAIAVDTISKRLAKAVPVELKTVVAELRTMRARSIPSLAQYVFLVICVLDYIKAKVPEHRVEIEKFREEVKEAKLQ